MENVGFVQYLIICPLVLIAGFIDAIAGGGGLITLPAYLISGLPAHSAIATNKLSSSMGTATATLSYALDGFIPWKLALPCAAFAIAGSNAGAHLSLLMDESVLKIVMLFLLPVTAFVVLKSKSFSGENERPKTTSTYVISASVALVLGAYDGFYGPGTGTFLILLLTVFSHLKLTEANGVTKVINFSSNIAALTVFLLNGQVLVPLGLTAGVFSIIGNRLGTRAFSKKGAVIAKPVMLTVLVIFFVKVAVELIRG